ncbi:hypothetical protein ACQPW1_40640 [Nocardia sp. CA-128927]
MKHGRSALYSVEQQSHRLGNIRGVVRARAEEAGLRDPDDFARS